MLREGECEGDVAVHFNKEIEERTEYYNPHDMRRLS
jgi:hypothetical protein